MSLVGSASATAGKGALGFISPIGKFGIYITIVAFLIIAGVSVAESVKEKSWFPLFDGIVLRFLGADHKIGEEVRALQVAEPIVWSKWFSTEFWQDLWRKVLFWFDVVMNFYFIYVMIFLFFLVFNAINSSQGGINVVLAIFLFAVFQVVIGLVLYPLSMSGQVLPESKVDVLNDAMGVSYPFEGTISMFSHLFGGDLFPKVSKFVDTPVGGFLIDVPDNESEVFGNGSGV